MKKETPLNQKEAGLRSGCVICGPKPITIEPKDTILATGFGMVSVTKDGEHIWDGDDADQSLQEFEEMAQKEPDADWRVHFMGPLSESYYQRQDGKWILYKTGLGFA